MKKRIIALLLAGAMTLSIAACGASNDAAKNDNAASGNTENASDKVVDTSDGLSLPATYPEKTVKIGVELYDPTDSETIALQNYFDALKAEGLNVDFIYSEALSSAEDEMAFIDNCYNAGCQAVFGYYNIAMGEAVTKCVDYGMYYAGSGLEYEDAYAAYADNDLALDIITMGEADYNSGYAIGEYLRNLGSKKIIYASGGADFGVRMFVERQRGFLDSIADSDIEVITVSGFPGDAFFADQASALSENVDGVAASFNGLDFWVQPIATAGKTDTVPIATFGALNQGFVDEFAAGHVAFLTSSNIQRFGVTLALIINAVDGNAEALQDNGKIGTHYIDMWNIDGSESAEKYFSLLQGTGVYRYKDIMSIIVNVNPNANMETVDNLVKAGGNYDAIMGMHEANDALWK